MRAPGNTVKDDVNSTINLTLSANTSWDLKTEREDKGCKNEDKSRRDQMKQARINKHLQLIIYQETDNISCLDYCN